MSIAEVFQGLRARLGRGAAKTSEQTPMPPGAVQVLTEQDLEQVQGAVAPRPAQWNLTGLNFDGIKWEYTPQKPDGGG
jgi:hypothetical protein